MRLTNDRTTHQVAQWLGHGADERDGRIFMSLMSRDYFTDTDEMRPSELKAMKQEAALMRQREVARVAALMADKL